MLAEIYIEALLVDEELADQVWEALDMGEIDDQVACSGWRLITLNAKRSENLLLRLGNKENGKPSESQERNDD